MKVNPTIFRTYDIRGQYPDELNEEAADAIARAYLFRYPHVRNVVLAYDTRESSPALANALQERFLKQGRDVTALGIASDPLFYFTISRYDYDGGVMVSGSHNPGAYNGLSVSVKLPGQESPTDVVGEELEALKNAIEAGERPEPAPSPGAVSEFDPTEEYTAYVAERITLKRPLKLILDSGNGAMGYLPEQVFRKLGCEAKTLYGEYDSSFPNHMPDPYQEENLRDIKEAVKREGADAGFAFDADGDRVAVVDNKGRTVSGDVAFLLLAKHVLEQHRGPVVHDVRISKAVLDELKKEGVESHFSVSHHNAVMEKVQETGAVFGGEITLHFVFPKDYYLVDDALFASLKLAEVVAETDDFASRLDAMRQYHASPEVFVETPDEEKFRIIENLKRMLEERGSEFIAVDGARINFENGWALARAANTTPHIKCRFEGDTPEALREIERSAIALFREAGIPFTEEHSRQLGLTG